MAVLRAFLIAWIATRQPVSMSTATKRVLFYVWSSYPAP